MISTNIHKYISQLILKEMENNTISLQQNLDFNVCLDMLNKIENVELLIKLKNEIDNIINKKPKNIIKITTIEEFINHCPLECPIYIYSDDDLIMTPNNKHCEVLIDNEELKDLILEMIVEINPCYPRPKIYTQRKTDKYLLYCKFFKLSNNDNEEIAFFDGHLCV